MSKFRPIEVRLAAANLAAAYALVTNALAGLLECEVRAVASHADAPSSLKTIKAAVASGVLPVSTEGGADTLYGELGNTCFRAMHDLGHCLYNKTVSNKDEKSLSIKLWRSLIKPLLKQRLSRAELDAACSLYFADTYGQTLYYEQYGEFVPNQVYFVMRLLAGDPTVVGLSRDRLEELNTVTWRN